MCESCANFDVETFVADYRSNVESLAEMHSVMNKMTDRDAEFAKDLFNQFLERSNLSIKQWGWVKTLKARVEDVKPIYGSFDGIHVMFRLAGGKLKNPRIRLITKEGKYLMLSFPTPEEGKREIQIATGGYARHGKRVFRGWIRNGAIVPYRNDSIDEDIELTIQEFSLDPINVAKAHAAKLGACVFCNKPLTDENSKALGYGPVCAKNYGLPTKAEK